MKKLFVLFFLAPFISKAQFTLTNSSTTSLVEVRTGNWPVDLQRIIKNTDTCYALNFRDQQVTTDVNMTTLRFGNKEQLHYFEQGLSALKSGSDGEIANYKDYTIKRMEQKSTDPKKKAPTVWYLVSCSNGPVTNIQQPEADKMIAAIKTL